MRTLRHRRALAAVPLVLCALLTGCGGDDGDSSSDRATSARDDAGGSGAPKECADAFPMAFGEPDVGEVGLMPQDWPDAVDDAVLCSTSSTADGSGEKADFATSEDEESVLSSFETALGGIDGYTVERGDSSGLGREMLEGTAGDVSFQVTTVPGGYTLSFVQG